MALFQICNTKIQNLLLIQFQIISDPRGYFAKTFSADIFAAHGISFTPVEELESCSCRHTLRGLHFQRRYSQDKLVRVLSGRVYDVAVDLRPDSETFGKWQGFDLSSESGQMLYIPQYFAHGFLVLSDTAVLHYLCGDRYDQESEDGIIWNDSELAINWPLDIGCLPILSPRDQGFSSFAAFRTSIGI